MYGVILLSAPQVTHPSTTPRHHCVSVLPGWEDRHYRWHIVALPCPRHLQRHLRLPLGYPSLHRRFHLLLVRQFYRYGKYSLTSNRRTSVNPPSSISTTL